MGKYQLCFIIWFSTAIVRAITAIPGHACFGVFMGVFYGLARKQYNRGKMFSSKIFRIFSIVVPVLLHGSYDFIASMENTMGSLYFVAFIIILLLCLWTGKHLIKE